MAPPETSRELREQGNQAYAEGRSDDYGPVVRRARLQRASKLYMQAFHASRSDDDRARCRKNHGAVHWTYAKVCLETSDNGKGFDGRDTSYDIIVSLESYLAALRYGKASGQSADWKNNIKEKLEEICRHVGEKENAWLLSTPKFVTRINALFQAEATGTGGGGGGGGAAGRGMNLKPSYWSIFQLGVAQHLFDEAMKEFGSRDSSGARNNRRCLSLLHSCDGPIEEARRNAAVEFVEKINALKASVDSTRRACEAGRAIDTGKSFAEESSRAKDSNSRDEKALAALDKFKEAADLAAEGLDTSGEGEALVLAGDLYNNVLHKDVQMRRSYCRAVRLARNCEAGTLSTTDWYQKANAALTTLAQRETEELGKLDAEFKKLSTEEFIRYVYTEHPPRVGTDGSAAAPPAPGGEPPSTPGTPGTPSTPGGGSTRNALRKALINYHPDRNRAANPDDEHWMHLCDEITKRLLQKNRLYHTESQEL